MGERRLARRGWAGRLVPLYSALEKWHVLGLRSASGVDPLLRSGCQLRMYSRRQSLYE